MTYVQHMTGNDTSQGVGGDTLASSKDSGGREGGIESEGSGASEAKEHPEEKKKTVTTTKIKRTSAMTLIVNCLYKDGVYLLSFPNQPPICRA